MLSDQLSSGLNFLIKFAIILTVGKAASRPSAVDSITKLSTSTLSPFLSSFALSTDHYHRRSHFLCRWLDICKQFLWIKMYTWLQWNEQVLNTIWPCFESFIVLSICGNIAYNLYCLNQRFLTLVRPVNGKCHKSTAPYSFWNSEFLNRSSKYYVPI